MDKNKQVRAWLLRLLADWEIRQVKEATNSEGGEFNHITISIVFEKE